MGRFFDYEKSSKMQAERKKHQKTGGKKEGRRGVGAGSRKSKKTKFKRKGNRRRNRTKNDPVETRNVKSLRGETEET